MSVARPRRLSKPSTDAATVSQPLANERPQDTTEGLGYRVRHTHKAFTRVLAEKLTPHQVSPGQWTVLRALWKEDGCSQVELANRIRIEKASLTSVLMSLEQKGYITRARSLEDRRRWYVRLTPAGRQLEGELLPFAAEIDSLATQGFTASERQQLKHLLARVMQNLG